jgi:hypothetical protein
VRRERLIKGKEKMHVSGEDDPADKKILAVDSNRIQTETIIHG